MISIKSNSCQIDHKKKFFLNDNENDKQKAPPKTKLFLGPRELTSW